MDLLVILTNLGMQTDTDCIPLDKNQYKLKKTDLLCSFFEIRQTNEEKR